MKKYISGLLTGLLIAVLSLGAFAAAVKLEAIPSPFPILINGTKADIEAYGIKGSTVIKLTDLKKVGVDAQYNKEKKQIEIKTIEGSTTVAEPVKNETIPEDKSTSNSVLEVTSTRTVDGLTVYTAGGKEYVHRWDVFAVLQKKNDSDNSKSVNKYNIEYSYYLDLPIDSVSGSKDNFVILTIGLWGANEDEKPINLSVPIEVTNVMVDKRFEPRLPYDRQLMHFIKLDDYEKYIKPVLDSDKSLKEIYDSHAK